MSLHRSWFVAGTARLIALVGCSSCAAGPTGLGPEQLDSRWTSVPSTSWTSVSSDVVESGQSTRDEVAQAFEELVSRRVECGRAPQTCDVSRLATEGSTIANDLRKLMSQRIAGGITASEDGSVHYRIESVDLDGVGTARVTTCLRDDTVLVSDGAVYDDSVYSARSEWSLVEQEGEWLWSNEKILEWAVDEDLCADS